MNIVLTEMVVHQQSRSLEVVFATGERFVLPFEYLRVFSPSAETRGHGARPMAWVRGKQAVNITAIEPVGHYGIKPIFDDGHNTGIFSWDMLYDLGTHQNENWQMYLLAIEG